MDHVRSLKCLVCGAEYSHDQIDYVCPKHGDDGIVAVQYRYDLIRTRLSPAKLAESREMTMWRYRELLPIRADAQVPPLAVGWTPLYETRRLAEALSFLRGQPGLVVLAVPRGGVVVGAEVARALNAPLDVVIARKIGAPACGCSSRVG